MEVRTNRLLQKNPSLVLEREGSTKSSSVAKANSSLGSIHQPSSAVPSRMELSLKALEGVKREQSSSRNLALDIVVVVDTDEDENHCSNDDSLSTIDSKEDTLGNDCGDDEDEDHVAPSKQALTKQGDAESSSKDKRTKNDKNDLPQCLPQRMTSTETLEEDRNRSHQNDNSFVFPRRSSTKSKRSSITSNESSFGSLLLGNSMTSIGSFSSLDSMRPDKKAGPQASDKKKSNINIKVNAINQRMEQRLNKLERLRRESFEASSCSLTLDMIALDEEGEDETYSDDSLSTIDGQYDESSDSGEEGGGVDGDGAGNADISSPAVVVASL